MTDTYLVENYRSDRHNGSTYTNDTTYYLYFENVDITKFRCYLINNINVNNYSFSNNNSIVYSSYNPYNKGFLNKFGNIENIQSIQYKIIQVNKENAKGGGKYSVKTQFKEVLGKKMRIYKIANSRKEHVKYKGDIITLAEYRKLMEKKSNSKKVLKSKKAVAANKK